MTHPIYGPRAEMLRVSQARPCPVCKKPDWCLVAPDGSAAICARVESPKRCKDAGWLHRLAEPTPSFGANPRVKLASAKNWQLEAQTYAANLDPDRRRGLAGDLGLPADALDALPLLGFDPAERCYTFPECDETGAVIGLNRRFADGSKRMMPGGKRGLTLPNGWHERAGPLLIVEGPTDTAVLVAAGLCAIGRPSNTGGVPLLAKLLRDWPTERGIVIVGENDRKESGEWPGRTGAESTARTLATKLNRSVKWALPPDGSKDARQWLTASEHGETPWPVRGQELLGFLEAEAVTIAPPTAGLTLGDFDENTANDAVDDPHRLARGFLVSVSGPLRFWRGDLFCWQNGAYRPVTDGDIRGELTNWIRREFQQIQRLELEAWKADSRERKGPPPKTRKVTTRLLGDVVNAVRGACLLPSPIDPPAWIDGTTGPEPVNLLPLRNGILDIPEKRLLPPSPNLFTLNVCPYDYEPNAPAPREWLRFLSQLWPDDPEAVATLQEWFGYLLTPDTRQQKILFLLGPKRSGKGTICRVLTALAGANNVAGPTLGSLAMNFGLSPLLGKTVSIVSDARLSGRADAATITERLLSISGEDFLTVDRKHRDPLTVKLSARFVIASNELPRLGDASGALAGRLILLRFTRSFFGSEDHGLTDRLLPELPGILNWSLEGWRRLRERGRFEQPESGAELMREMEDLASPVGAFLRECCRVEPGATVEVSALYTAWRNWCDDHGRKEPGTEQMFGRDIRAAVPTVSVRRPKQSGERWREYVGIRLRMPGEADETEVGPRGSAGSAVLSNARDAKTEDDLGKRGPEETRSRGTEAAIEGTADPADPADPRGPAGVLDDDPVAAAERAAIESEDDDLPPGATDFWFGANSTGPYGVAGDRL
jgi:putative DNA primase/helicase